MLSRPLSTLFYSNSHASLFPQPQCLHHPHPFPSHVSFSLGASFSIIFVLFRSHAIPSIPTSVNFTRVLTSQREDRRKSSGKQYSIFSHMRLRP
ncbi:hypothetical protein CALCODRAFT_214315 [Calocera cornea HHB12733]|uniref:Uncharacterized protein n=1 Tax=Calocera cornea HHB12733 TaxID=1353952 RepID=A0A165HBG5_9BASI|nr:hypothetical protein CALCODRAFT_214315 [Calocera cornea HHB12733]